MSRSRSRGVADEPIRVLKAGSMEAGLDEESALLLKYALAIHAATRGG
jgi:hypothetical protein